ncbi:MAG: hypothetical protein VYC91_05470 [Acidobacteriota bacterium]|nr:hypothetical protein [Acidobacteriota bacterium]
MTNNIKATFLVLLIFASGIVLGGILAFFLVQPRFPGPGRGGSPLEMEALVESLGLDDSQRGEFRKILGESRQVIIQLRREVNRRNRAIREGTLEQIRQILDPEQMEEFEELLARQNRMRQRQRPNPGSRRPQPNNPR